jgi:hypothetical protein
MTYPLITPYERVHGSDTKVGTMYTPNCNPYVIYVINDNSSAVDLQTQDSYGGNAVVNGVIEVIVNELNPLAWYTPADSSGKIYVILDKSADEGSINPMLIASELTTRIQRLSANVYGSDTPSVISLSHSEVWPATSFNFGDND